MFCEQQMLEGNVVLLPLISILCAYIALKLYVEQKRGDF